MRTIVVAALLAGLAAAAVFYTPRAPKAAAEPAAKPLAVFDVADRAAFYASGGKNGLFIAAKDGARFLSGDGTELMSTSYTMRSPAVAGGGAVCAVLERGGYTAYVMNQTQRLYSVTADYPILSAYVNPRGYLCLILKDGETHRVNVYGGGGEQRLAAEYVNKRVTPINAAVSDDGRILAVAFLDAEAAEAVSFIHFYYINKSESVNTNNADGMFAYSGDRPGHLIGPMKFYENTLVAVADDALLRFEPEKPGLNKLEEPLNGRLTAVALDDKRVAVAFGDSGDEPPGRVRIYDAQLKLKGEYDAGAAVTLLTAAHGGVVVGAGKTFTVLNAAAEAVYSCAATADVKKAVLISPGELALCGAAEAQVVKFK